MLRGIFFASALLLLFSITCQEEIKELSVEDDDVITEWFINFLKPMRFTFMNQTVELEILKNTKQNRPIIEEDKETVTIPAVEEVI